MTKQEHLRKTILATSQSISREVEAQHPDLKLNFILFRRGQRQDECERSLSRLKNHVCGLSAKELLHNINSTPEISAFVGIAGGVEKSFLGLRSKNHFIAFIAINIDSYLKPEECELDLYHFAAHALDIYHLVDKKNLHFSQPNIILEPKRNQLALSRSNLKSDTFSALALYSQGKEKIELELAQIRARRSLSTQTFYRPEDYPFVIATDVMKYSIENQLGGKAENLANLFDLSGKIASSFDKYNLKSWANFAIPAQTLAWSGCTPEQILGIAVQTSSDPLIKAIANLICEITNIKPEFSASILNVSNPFVAHEVNSRNHAKLTEESFELAIVHAMQTESHLPLLQTANQQNHDLMKGRVLGWCADALQLSARTFEQALKKGIPADSTSRIEFKSLIAKTESDLQNLESLNSYMVSQRRNGHAITFQEIGHWSGKRIEMKHIMDSLSMTLNDPEYVAELNYVNEVPVPKGPAPQIQPQAAPSIGYAPSLAPAGMGGMMGGAGAVQQKKPVTKTEEQT